MFGLTVKKVPFCGAELVIANLKNNNLKTRELPEDTPLDSITEDGYYTIYYTGGRYKGWVLLRVRRFANNSLYPEQILSRNNNIDSKTYKRTCDNGVWSDWSSYSTTADLDNKTPMNGKLITTSIKTAVLSNPAVSFGVFAFSLSPDAPPNLESGFVMYFRHNNLTLNTTLVALYGNVMVYGRIEGNNLRWF